MEKLYLLRHGIAEPRGAPEFSDDERPLTAQGKKRVRKVASALRRLDLELDRILSSPLPRALETAEIVADVLGLNHLLETAEPLRADREATEIRDWLRSRPERNLMLVGHNPSLSELIGLLIAGPSRPLELRKAGVAALSNNPGAEMRLDWLARPRLMRRLIDC